MKFYAGTILMLLLAGVLGAACNTSSAATQANSTATPVATPLVPTMAAPSATPQPTATLTPTETPTAIPSATATVTPTASPTPTPAPQLRQVTQGGCCVQPDFSPDSQQILFVDKPDAESPVGIYGVRLDGSLPDRPQLVNDVIGFRSPDRTVVATMDGDQAVFSNEATGDNWQVDTGGNWPRFSPDGSQILWVATDREGPYDRRRSDVWLANLDGSSAQRIYILYGGGFSGWFPNGERILLVGRDDPRDELQNLIRYNPGGGQTDYLASHKRIRGIEMSPGGRWVAYFVDFAEDDPAKRGLWVVNTDSAERKKLNIPAFGGYQWRDENTLLLIPMRTSATESMQLWSIDVAKNQATPLTDPQTLQFSISNGDWAVSPDGRWVAFVNSADQNIWAIRLP